MPILTPKVGAHLLKATHAHDLDEAFSRVFTEYLFLKIQNLQQTIDRLEEKWGMDFGAFKQRMHDETLSSDVYGYDIEQDFWQWEEAETLKEHYTRVQSEWT